MIRIELPVLINKLNAQTKLALEQAAALCMSRESNEVTFEHFLFSLLENPLSDVRVLINHAGLNSEIIKQTCGEAMPHEIGNDTYPSFSPLLVELLQEAWLLASIEMNEVELRSGVIFLAALIRPDRYLAFNLIKAFENINRESFRKQFSSLVMESSETAVTNTALAQTTPALSNDNSTLARFCSNFTEQARQGKLDPVLCRDNEINLMIDILCRRRKNNPIVVGDAGVGKSAVIEGLASRIVAGKVPESLQQVELWALDLGLMQAGASVKGEFEKRLKSVLDEVKHSATPIILFIDEAHTMIGAGNQEGSGDAANLLKPALARGELCTIAATTWKEYKKYFEKDPALTRRFQLVKLDEPTTEQAVDIMRGLHSVYENAHNVLISDDALRAAAELSARYVSGRQLPDKAIDVLDTACARIAINLSAPPRRIAEIESRYHQRQLEIKMIHRQQQLGLSIDDDRLAVLIEAENIEQTECESLYQAWQQQKILVTDIIETRKQILSPRSASIAPTDKVELSADELRDRLVDLYAQLEQIPHDELLIYPEVDAAQIAQVIADWTGVPVDQMNTDELTKITELPRILGEAIKGQDVAIAGIHRHLLTARADLRRPGRPKGAFLLVGPSGVGKTETVIQLAEQLYGGQQFLTTINMSEYQEKHTVSRLIGSPPGYVGFGEGGVLTEAMRKMPYSIVLLDEVEKAHPEVLNLFYQAFDKGELADGEGRIIDCQNIVFFLTSNLGYQTIVDYADQPELLEEKMYPELAAFFKPALLARMEVVPYLPLNKEVLEQIVRGKLSRLDKLLTTRYKAEVIIEPCLIEEILRRATRAENGARMLEAIIEGQMLPPVSLALLNRLAHREAITRIHLTVADGQFCGEVE
ncbi:type VI secretion system ATPase TssH [Photobacterium kishitanii]|uniref:type VI secretion system ATPase TssH n=1 Tax=Photobacterium kishitanii TaxID=318456 RepID=UPI0007EFA4C8|nr:type VI secretion system ATPase TssH [Photobacterium kishitanii]OBU28810.1 ClpV1 family T6SS ATPase [Photobacterium kishitanii]PSU86492.1 type VI secretion system ATPase TssH [Photobacterium kishitanii]PSU90745.1 type VI secretion system ATPase TssH [Photobacterium kishitanii]PSW69164.1 type VI secretion system ATPase TssH [Photobacterium kishitanii]